MKQPIVIISGNIIDGVGIIGPFHDPSRATEWAAIHLKDEDWVTVNLLDPEDRTIDPVMSASPTF